MSAVRTDWPNDIQEPVSYTNTRWAVTAYGLESLDRYCSIEISRWVKFGREPTMNRPGLIP